jgi:rod shape-determining protein MreC
VTPGGSSWPAAIDGDAAARIARLMFYALLAIILMTLDYRGRYVEKIRALGWRAVEPVVLAVEAPFALGRRLGEEMRTRHELMNDIAALERQRRQQSAELALLQELRNDNRELRALLEASRRLETTYRSAELMKIDLNPWSHRVVINRGSSDGLSTGQPVMDSLGVIGQVDELGLRTAQVILISDPDHALPVRVQRTGLRTVAYGSGRINRLRLTDLPMNVDLAPGDRLVTSGLGGAFPPGLPVAEVESVLRPAGEAFARAQARPLGRLDRARHVLVVDTPEPDVEAAPEPDAEEAPAGESATEATAAEPDGDDSGGEVRS